MTEAGVDYQQIIPAQDKAFGSLSWILSPCSPLEALVLVGTYLLGFSDRQLAEIFAKAKGKRSFYYHRAMGKSKAYYHCLFHGLKPTTGGRNEGTEGVESQGSDDPEGKPEHQG